MSSRENKELRPREIRRRLFWSKRCEFCNKRGHDEQICNKKNQEELNVCQKSDSLNQEELNVCQISDSLNQEEKNICQEIDLLDYEKMMTEIMEHNFNQYHIILLADTLLSNEHITEEEYYKWYTRDYSELDFLY